MSHLRFLIAIAFLLGLLLTLGACAPSTPAQDAPSATPLPTVTQPPAATPTPSPTLAPIAANTPDATATRAPTLAPTPTQTEIPRPAPVVVARYGNPNDVLNFNYPDRGGMQYTISVFKNELTFAPDASTSFGVRKFSVLTFPNGGDQYNQFRNGKAGGPIFDTSGYFLPVQNVRWADQARGTFIIISQVVNTKGVLVTAEITLSKDNPVYDHIPPSDKRWGGKFYQLIGSDGPVQANPGLMRDRKSETEFDVIGLGGTDNTNTNSIKNAIDGFTGPNSDKPLQINGLANNQGNNWLILLAH